MQRAIALCDRAMLFVGMLMVLYIGSATFGFLSSSARHYAAFMVFVMVMSGLAAFRVVAGERLGLKVIDDGFAAESYAAAHTSILIWVKAALALLGTLLAVACSAYLWVNADRLERAAPFFEAVDLTMGGGLVAGILMLTLIHWGPTLASLVALAIAYFFFGQHISHPLLSHTGYDAAFVMNYLGLGVTQGFFLYAQTAADDIFFLVIYATTLFGLGMMPMIVEAGRLAGGRLPGGAAAPAVLGSGMVGAVMGTAVSNVVLCGRFTIPLMTKYGYSRAMAGAIEATASTCGQIMPPVLGLAAFLIASFLGMAYIDVVKAAVLPGVLYITGVSIGVSIYAMRHRLPRLTEPVNLQILWRLAPAFGISFLTVIVLLVNYYSPSTAGIAGVVVALVLSVFQGPYRPKFSELKAAFQEGLMLVSLLSLLLIAIGPLGQAFQTTNLSGKLGIWLISILPDSRIILLIGAAFLSIVLGIGLPTPVAYLIASLAVVPFMIQIGTAPLLAHYFVFYFAVYATLSPPVAESVLAAAKLSGAGFWETGVHAMKLAATTFIIPFAFVFNPELMQFPNISWKMVGAVAEVLVVQWTSSMFLYGYFRRGFGVIERFLSFAIVMLGYTAIMRPEALWTYVAIGSTIAFMAWVWLSPGASAPARKEAT